MATSLPLGERLVVTPLLEPSQIGEASIDLRLGTEFLILRRTTAQASIPAAPNSTCKSARSLID